MFKGLHLADYGVEFENVKFLKTKTLEKDQKVELVIVIHSGSGSFEISDGSSTLVTGIIKIVEQTELLELERQDQHSEILHNNDFYKELRLRGYHYSGVFRSVTDATSDGLYGKVKWEKNWIAFLDCLFQIQILGQDTRSLLLPTSVQRIVIDTPKQLKIVHNIPEGSEALFDVIASRDLKTMKSGGVEIVNLQTNVFARCRPSGIPILEVNKFIPYHHTETLSLSCVVRIIIQLALESVPTTVFKAVELDNVNVATILSEVQNSIRDLPLVTSDLTLLSSRNLESENGISIKNAELSAQSAYLIIASNCIHDIDFLTLAAKSFNEKGFVVCRESRQVLKHSTLSQNYSVISSLTTENEKFILLQYNNQPRDLKKTRKIFIRGSDTKFKWIEEVKTAMKCGPIVLVAENEPQSGLIGLVNCLRREPGGTAISCVFIDDKNAPEFSLVNSFYQNQLKLELAINVLRNGEWGSFRYLQMQQNHIEKQTRHHCYVHAEVRPDSVSLSWTNGPPNYLESQDESIKVHYAALNYRDVMLATSKRSTNALPKNRLDEEYFLGIEYSGVTKDGKRVMGLGMTSSAKMVSFYQI